MNLTLIHTVVHWQQMSGFYYCPVSLFTPVYCMQQSQTVFKPLMSSDGVSKHLWPIYSKGQFVHNLQLSGKKTNAKCEDLYSIWIYYGNNTESMNWQVKLNLTHKKKNLKVTIWLCFSVLTESCKPDAANNRWPTEIHFKIPFCYQWQKRSLDNWTHQPLSPTSKIIFILFLKHPWHQTSNNIIQTCDLQSASETNTDLSYHWNQSTSH